MKAIGARTQWTRPAGRLPGRQAQGQSHRGLAPECRIPDDPNAAPTEIKPPCRAAQSHDVHLDTVAWHESIAGIGCLAIAIHAERQRYEAVLRVTELGEISMLRCHDCHFKQHGGRRQIGLNGGARGCSTDGYPSVPDRIHCGEVVHALDMNQRGQDARLVAAGFLKQGVNPAQCSRRLTRHVGSV